MMIADHVGYAFMAAGILVAVWAVSQGLRGRRRPLWSVATTATGLTFAGLAPLKCGMLTSNPPSTSCASFSGFRWGVHPALGSFWNNDHTVMTAQAVLLGHAAAIAAAVLVVAWSIPCLVVRPGGEWRVRRRIAVLAVTSAVVAVACAGPSTVEASVRDSFVDCMAEEGVTVENVEVVVRDGRHIETFSWDTVGDAGVDEIGQECEDTALRRLEVSRT